MHGSAAAPTVPASGDGAGPGFRLRTRASEGGPLVLWLPVALGAGIGAYFALGAEPEFWIAPSFAALALAFAIAGRGQAAVLALALLVGAASCGFALAQRRAHDVAAPVVERRMGPVPVTGRVLAVEPRAEGTRLVLDRVAIGRLPPASVPERVRLRVDDAAGLVPGDEVRVPRAFLVPPPEPAVPGAFDFARQAWFERLGALGHARGPVERLGSDGEGGWRLAAAGLRAEAVARIRAVLPDPAGAIAAALIAGEQGAIPPGTLEAFRDSGLQHILSISGLHIGMVAGLVFGAIRLFVSFVPALALRIDAKKVASVGAFVAITLYALFAVPSVPTQRSWLMTSVVLFAVLIDRRAITLRLVAWAATALLVAAPESLMSASFQMSFAAVACLVAAYEAARGPLARLRAAQGLPARAASWLAGGILTSLVAGLASAPFALYHFNRFSAYGLVANMAGVPLTGIWIMPWAVAAGLLYPFGLEEWALVPMGWGIDLLIVIAAEVASWDGAAALLPSMPDWGLALVAAGLAVLCVARGLPRLAGLPAVAAGLASLLTAVPPDILVSGDGRLVAVREAGGALMLSSPRGGGFARETWLRRDGAEAAGEAWPRNGVSADGRLECRAGGCVYAAGGVRVAIVRDARLLPAACRDADLVIAAVHLREPCRRMAGRTLDRFDLFADGAHAVWLAKDGIRIESVRMRRGDRPWVPARPAS